MDNPEKLATLGTQDEDKLHRKQKAQHRKTKKMSNTYPPKTSPVVIAILNF
jgi:hypothetical protein